MKIQNLILLILSMLLSSCYLEDEWSRIKGEVNQVSDNQVRKNTNDEKKISVDKSLPKTLSEKIMSIGSDIHSNKIKLEKMELLTRSELSELILNNKKNLGKFEINPNQEYVDSDINELKSYQFVVFINDEYQYGTQGCAIYMEKLVSYSNISFIADNGVVVKGRMDKNSKILKMNDENQCLLGASNVGDFIGTLYTEDVNLLEETFVNNFINQIDEVLSELQGYTIEWGKLPSTVDGLSYSKNKVVVIKGQDYSGRPFTAIYDLNIDVMANPVYLKHEGSIEQWKFRIF